MPSLSNLEHHVDRAQLRLTTWYNADQMNPPLPPLVGFRVAFSNGIVIEAPTAAQITEQTEGGHQAVDTEAIFDMNTTFSE